MSTPYVSQTQYGKNEAFNLQVARGQITGHRGLRINAYNLSLDNALTTIWPKDVIYVFPPSATVMTVSSSSTLDTTQLVLIQGLNANYTEIQEVVAINGQTPVNTTRAYKRINRLQIVAGNLAGNLSVGVGTVTDGVPATTYGYIAAGDGLSQSTVYTIPAGWTLYVTQNVIAVGGLASTASSTVDFKLNNLTGSSYLLGRFTQGNDSTVMVLDPPVGLPEKSDIYANATVPTGTGTVSIALSGILIKNTTD